MNGAPANPIRGVLPKGPVGPERMRTASRTGATSSSVTARRAATPAASRIGSATTGPTPGTMSRSTPMALSGTTMSEKKMAASTPCRRTGWSVISTTRSGVKQDASIAVPSRILRYSGSERPAWRMNHTGVCSTASPRAARSSAASAVRPATRGWSGPRAAGGVESSAVGPDPDAVTG